MEIKAESFLRVTKANEYIASLVDEASAQIKALTLKVEAAEANAVDAASAGEAIKAELMTAKASVADLTNKLAAKDAELATVAANFAKEKEALKQEASKQASNQALNIVAQTGTPIPAVQAPSANPASTTAPKPELKGLAALAAKFAEQLKTLK